MKFASPKFWALQSILLTLALITCAIAEEAPRFAEGVERIIGLPEGKWVRRAPIGLVPEVFSGFRVSRSPAEASSDRIENRDKDPAVILSSMSELDPCKIRIICRRDSGPKPKISPPSTGYTQPSMEDRTAFDDSEFTKVSFHSLKAGFTVVTSSRTYYFAFLMNETAFEIESQSEVSFAKAEEQAKQVAEQIFDFNKREDR